MLAKHRNLNQLRVYVERGYEQTPITSETWLTVLGFIPDLEVSFHILFAIESEKFAEMLVPGVPLVGLDWLTRKDEDSRTWDHEEVLLIFEYMVEVFPNTLRFITLGLDDYPRKFVTLFDDILDKCLNIETLSVKAPDDRGKTFQMALAKFVTWAYERQPLSSFRELRFNDEVLLSVTGPYSSRN
uniref:Uncharacterized protein n=1 Tax=Biomphalaria glabrata TaxID=6526 RepID=A0A2C9LME7_BIOGL